MTVAPSRPHTDAVAAALQDVGLLVDRGRPPAGAGWQGEPGASQHRPYVVLFPAAAGTDGDLADPHHYFDYVVQATCVAASQEGAEAVADLVTATLVGAVLTVPGRSCYPVQLVASPPVRRDDTVTPAVHYATPVYRLRSQPA